MCPIKGMLEAHIGVNTIFSLFVFFQVEQQEQLEKYSCFRGPAPVVQPWEKTLEN